MIRTFTISNFRTFSDLTISDLKRVNLIAGMNNVGKTSLLEALWQFTGPDSPELGVRLNQFRGFSLVSTSKLLHEFFYRYDTSTPAYLKAQGDWGDNERSLDIRIQARDTSRIAVHTGDGSLSTGSLVDQSSEELVLNYRDEIGEYESRGWLEVKKAGTGLVEPEFATKSHEVPGRPAGVYFSSGNRLNAQNDPDRLSQVELQGAEASVVDALRSIEPDLSRLTIVTMNGTPIIHAKVGQGRLMPIGLMGDGMQRLLSVVLAFETAKNGLLLLDEIENGIHYSKLPDLWQVISSFSEKYNTQVFATTHSDECVQAAHQIFSETEDYNFSYCRLDRIGEDIKVKNFDQVLLETAFDSNFEIR